MESTKKNYIYQVLYQILVSIIPFITSPYLSRVLGADGIGIYSYTYSIITFFMIFAQLGILNYGNRAIARVRNDQDRLNETFCSLFSLHFIISIIIILFYVIYVKLYVTEYVSIFLIQGLYLLATLFDISWFFFGMEEFKVTVIRNSMFKVIATIAIFLFVQNSNDIWKYTLILALGNFLTILTLWLYLPKYVKFAKFSIKEMILHLKPMFVLFFSVIAISIFSYMDKIMIGAWCSKSELGYYENAWKMIEFPASFITALGTVMLPKISNLLIKGNNENSVNKYVYKSMRFSMILSVALAFGVAAIANEFSVIFWGENFSKCGILMGVMSITIIIMSWNSVIRTQYLIPRGFDKIYLLAMCGGAFINLIANIALIPQFGAIGAAFGTVFAYLGIFLIQTIHASKGLPVIKYLKETVPYILNGIIMFVIIKLISNFMNTSIVLLILEIFVGCMIYSIFAIVNGYVFKDQFILDALNNIIESIKRKFIR